MTAHWKPDGKL